MDWLKVKLKYTTWEDWYKVSYSDFTDNFGGGFVSLHHKSSATSAVMSVYKNDFDWEPWKFNHVPNGWWFERANVRYSQPLLERETHWVLALGWFSFHGRTVGLAFGGVLGIGWGSGLG